MPTVIILNPNFASWWSRQRKHRNAINKSNLSNKISRIALKFVGKPHLATVAFGCCPNVFVNTCGQQEKCCARARRFRAGWKWTTAEEQTGESGQKNRIDIEATRYSEGKLTAWSYITYCFITDNDKPFSACCWYTMSPKIIYTTAARCVLPANAQNLQPAAGPNPGGAWLRDGVTRLTQSPPPPPPEQVLFWWTIWIFNSAPTSACINTATTCFPSPYPLARSATCWWKKIYI